jgi:hypothetical protein
MELHIEEDSGPGFLLQQEKSPASEGGLYFLAHDNHTSKLILCSARWINQNSVHLSVSIGLKRDSNAKLCDKKSRELFGVSPELRQGLP